MTVLLVRMAPDPVLRQVCGPVTDFDARLASLLEDLLDTMYAAQGRGLAAPQIGVPQRVFVMDEAWKSGNATPRCFVNPKVCNQSDVHVTLDEGCLSIPDQTTRVSRPAEIQLRWQDPQGARHDENFTGFAAACIQHEVDHLNGVLITDYAR